MTPLLILEIIGTFAFALSGAVVAYEKKMDIFGMSVLAIAAASGGGMLRSALIGDYPIAFLTNPVYLVIALFAVVIIFYWKKYIHKYQRLLLLADAVGLGIFVSLGVSIALAHGYSEWASVLLGIVTATFGGVIRDILAAEVPLIFRKELYATAALAGGITFVLLALQGWPVFIPIASGAVVTIGIRLLAIRHKWSLPRPT